MRLAFVLWIVLTASAGAETLWKLSDPLGADRGDAPQARPGRGWILRVETRAGGEDRTLFQDGKEASTRLLDFDTLGRVSHWRDLRAGQPVWDVTFDAAAGVPVTETTFDNGAPAEISTLTFQSRLLIRRTVKTPDGALLYEDRLSHWPDGSLRRLERDGPNGPLANAAWSYGPDRRLQAAWLADAEALAQGGHRSWIFAAGRTEEVLAGEAASLTSRVTEALDGGRTKETITVPSGRQEATVTDELGRTTQVTISLKNEVLQTRSWKYDDQNRPIELKVESAGPLEVWTYGYTGDLTESTLTRDGQTSRIETARNGEKQAVQLFDRGALFLIETWENGKKTKETYYDRGQVVRERRP